QFCLVGCWDEGDLEVLFLDSFCGQFEGPQNGVAASESDGGFVSDFSYCLCSSAYPCLVCPGQVLVQPSVSICSRRSMALSTSSRMVSSRSSALFFGFSFAGRSFGEFVIGGVWLVSILGGSESLVDASDAIVTVGLIWLIFRSISSIFSWKLLRRSSLADSSS